MDTPPLYALLGIKHIHSPPTSSRYTQGAPVPNTIIRTLGATMIKKTLKRPFIWAIRTYKRLTKSAKEKRHALVGFGHLWKMKRDFQFSFLMEQGLAPQDRFIDIGCGTLRGGIPIIDYLDKGNYHGIDVRQEAIDAGMEELRDHRLEHKEPVLLSFDRFDDLQFHSPFDVMFAFSVLIHMEDSVARDCFQFVADHLAPDGVFYANVNNTIRPDGNWQGFPVAYRSEDFYKALAQEFGLTLKNIGMLKEMGHISGHSLADDQVMLEIRKSR